MLSGKLIHYITRSIFNAMLPPACVLCGMTTRRFLNICIACQKDLPILAYPCPQCAQNLPMSAKKRLKCGACLSNPPPFDCTFALFPYLAPVVKLITDLKFHHQLSHAKLLGDLMTEKIHTDWYTNGCLPEVILPIPLHAKRLKERGFNQALEIANPIAKSLSIPLDRHGVVRIKHTAAQSSLHAAERKLNMAQAFELRHDYRGKHIAVLDDVITTGHTMIEFCRLLKSHGARKIDVWCCARRELT